MRPCEREHCNQPRDPHSPLYLCTNHQNQVDSKRLGWNDNYRALREPPHWTEELIGK